MTYIGHFRVTNLKWTNQKAFNCHVIADSAVLGKVQASEIVQRVIYAQYSAPRYYPLNASIMG